MATGYVINRTTVYYGPSSTLYPSIDFESGATSSVGPNESVTVLWQEGSWYYIEYDVSGTSRKKRMYIVSSAVSNISGSLASAPVVSRTVTSSSSQVYTGPSTSTYVQAGSIGVETVTVYNKIENSMTFIEYNISGGQRKRGWVPNSAVGGGSGGPANHTYLTYSSGGVSLQMIRTRGSNIVLASLGETRNLLNSGEYGINGGFFDVGLNQTLNIAVNNGVPVIGQGVYGGLQNHMLYGTLIWTGSAFTFQERTYASQITGSHVWAQGGYPMYLQYSDWRTRIGEDWLTIIDANSARPRTGIVGTSNGDVYLIISPSATVAGFRSAIQAYVGSVSTALILDGGGSTQLRCRNASGAEVGYSQSRPLLQIIKLEDKT